MYELRVKDEYRAMYESDKRCIQCDEYEIKKAGGYHPADVIYPIVEGVRLSRVWKKHFEIVDTTVPASGPPLDTVSVGFGAELPNVKAVTTVGNVDKIARPKLFINLEPAKKRKAVKKKEKL